MKHLFPLTDFFFFFGHDNEICGQQHSTRIEILMTHFETPVIQREHAGWMPDAYQVPELGRTRRSKGQ